MASPVGTMGVKFPDRPEDEFIEEIEALIARKGSPGAAEAEAIKIPDESQWTLTEVNGDALVGGTYATLEIDGGFYGGYDGRNSFGGGRDMGPLSPARKGRSRCRKLTERSNFAQASME